MLRTHAEARQYHVHARHGAVATVTVGAGVEDHASRALCKRRQVVPARCACRIRGQGYPQAILDGAGHLRVGQPGHSETLEQVCQW